ncbi:NAD(P)/FAD-dependent oxidoreductase [bacterium]|nr:NAD(P)/FAD-dependent oxidoreductase [bacterium]
MKKEEYDVIIIGAGIGGLVCGCYLAKAGMKVLIAEKNDKPGGYCTSFKYKGFHFDACVHILASCRRDGTLGKIIDELQIDTLINIKAYDPPNIIIMPDKRIKIYRKYNKTLDEFIRWFPKESYKLRDFFNYIYNTQSLSFITLRNITFKDFLDGYFNDEDLKNLISKIVLICTGVFSSCISAFIACSTLKEYFIDGGYYPKGGIQSFTNALVKRFLSLGGELFLSREVKKIKIITSEAKGISFDNKNFISSKYVISNCDAIETFSKLIRKSDTNSYFSDKLLNMVPTLSAFVVYIALKKKLKDFSELKSTLYYLSRPSSEFATKRMLHRCKNDYFICTSPSLFDSDLSKSNLESFLLLTNAHYKNKEFWDKNKMLLADNLIKKVNNFIPNFSKSIYFKKIATPYTLFKRTLNYKGAAYGWAGIPTQICDPCLVGKTKIRNLYLVGHWTTQSHGVISVAYVGARIAKLIIKEYKFHE